MTPREPLTRYEAIKARVEKAFTGPWKVEGPRFGYFTVRQDPHDWDGQGYQTVCGMPSLTKNSSMRPLFEGTADFIAHAREDIPYLLKRVTDVEARDQAREAEIRALIDEYRQRAQNGAGLRDVFMELAARLESLLTPSQEGVK
jgi:hypothetical protein